MALIVENNPESSALIADNQTLFNLTDIQTGDGANDGTMAVNSSNIADFISVLALQLDLPNVSEGVDSVLFNGLTVLGTAETGRVVAGTNGQLYLGKE